MEMPKDIPIMWSNWESVIANQQMGMFGLFALVAMGFVYYLVAVRYYPVLTRLSVVVPSLLVTVASAPSLALASAMAWGLWGTLRERFSKYWWILLVALILIMRLPHINDSLWYDETFTARLISSPTTYTSLLVSDVHPPLFYAVSYAVRSLGNSELTFRLPALIFGIASIFLAILVIMPHSKNAAILTGFVLALLPSHIYYSVEARAYSMLLWGVLAVIHGIQSQKRSFLFMGAIFVSGTHHIGNVYVIVAMAILAYRRNWLSAALLCIPVLINVPLIVIQSSDVRNGFWITPLNVGAIIEPLFSMTIGKTLYGNLGLSVGIAFSVLLALWSSRQWLWNNPQISAFFAVPVLIAMVSIIQNVYLDRALLPIAVLLVMVVCYGIVEAYESDRRVLLSIFAPTILISALWYTQNGTGRLPLRDLVRSGCGTLPIYATSIPVGMIGSYYGDSLTLWNEANDLNQSLTADAKHAAFDVQALPPKTDYCLLYLNSPRTSDHEREYVGTLTQGLEGRTLASTDTFELIAYRVNYGIDSR